MGNNRKSKAQKAMKMGIKAKDFILIDTNYNLY